MKNPIRLAVFSCLLWSSTLTAQTVPTDLDSLLRHTLDSMLNVLNAKSLSAAMQFPDGSVWAHAKGISSVNPPVNVTPDDVYLIGSVTKTITSACILQLADEGVLNIDDSLYQWLDTMPYINPNITIRQLLQHTSGIFDVLANPQHQDSLLADISRIWTPEELIERFISPPLFQPGASWSYSNTNYFLLGMIIKKATGNLFYTEIRNRFYDPLGLGSFAIPAFEPLNSPVAHVWLDITGDNVTDDAHDFYMNYMALNSTAGAAGGYFSTPTDCTKWMRTYMRGDLLSPEMMTEAKTLVNAPGSQGGKYGLGLMKNLFLGNLAYGHGGDLAYHASSWYFPEKDISITVFTNDDKKNSWTLLPVIAELLRSCMNYQPVTTTSNSIDANVLKMSAFPNPFDEQIRVEWECETPASAVEFTLQDVLGNTIATSTSQQPDCNQPILFGNLSALPSGLYYVSAKVDGIPMYTLKMVK